MTLHIYIQPGSAGNWVPRSTGQLGSDQQIHNQLGGCSTLSGRKYSQAEVKGLLGQAGWPSDLIEKMSAIIMGESSGYACAHNGCGEDSWGLGQVYVTVHPEYSASDMCDPIKNLRACLAIYNARGGGNAGFNAWGAYSSGRYLAYMGQGGGAITPSGTSTAGTAAIDIGGLQITPTVAAVGILAAILLLS
jgi:hypothetical protein